MGSFNISPIIGNQYHAIVTNPKGKTKQFELPQTISEGAALTINNYGAFLQVKIRAKGNDLPKPFYIMAHSCESLIFTEQVKQLQYNIPTKNLPEGILNFVLVNGNMKPVSSRLVYIKQSPSASIEIESNKPTYKPREKVSLT